jgi:hypothetical protein
MRDWLLRMKILCGCFKKKKIFFFPLESTKITFMPVAVDTSGRIYDDFSRLLFFNVTVKHRLWVMNFVWGTGTPTDGDEVNKREVCECDV